MKSLSIFLTIAFSISSGASELWTIYQNNLAVKDLKEEKILEASERLQKAIGEDPNSLLLQFNLAGVYFRNKDLKAAKAIYQGIVSHYPQLDLNKIPQAEAQLLYMARFNLGVVYSEEKNKELAVKAFYSALEIEASDKASKINIELLLSKNQSQSDGEGESSDNQDGKDQENKKNKDKQDKNDKEDPNQEKKDEQKSDQQKEQKKPKPQKGEFKENNLSKQDVKQMFEELKRQEEKIRAKMQEGQAKEKQLEKDW